ncbi:MAG: hypothetical protein H0X30_00250 [Anaerolineae bacterium]|nr:hypothetical protein [Anaerolineae bacterium]
MPIVEQQLAEMANGPDVRHELQVIAAEGTATSPWKIWHSVSLIVIVVALVAMEGFVPANFRLWMWWAIMLLLALFGIIAGNGVTGQWLGLFIDTRNKVSLARFQMILWTILILSAYLTGVMVNVDLKRPEPLSIVIPPDLWLLMGISTTSLIGSPLILSAKKARESNEPDKQRALEALNRQAVDTDKVTIVGQLVVNQAPETARWADMFQGSEIGNVGQLDLGKVQMFFFTLILVLAYASALSTLFQQSTAPVLALPVIDGGMLALLGISHAGYLVNKALPHSDSE